MAEAFLSLVAQRIPLDSGEIRLSHDPARAFRAHANETDQWALDRLEEEQDWLLNPHPVYYGVELALMDDYGAPDQAILTYALWHLFKETAWQTSLDNVLYTHMAETTGDDALVQFVTDLPPLPPKTPVTKVLRALGRKLTPTPQRGVLIAYAFERTENPLADFSNDEILRNYGVSNPWTWDDLERLATYAAPARAIKEEYDLWCLEVQDDPYPQLTALAAELHRVTRKHLPTLNSRTLVDILADADQGAILAGSEPARTALEAL